MTKFLPKLCIARVATIPENKREPQKLKLRSSLTGRRISSIKRSHMISEKMNIHERESSVSQRIFVIGPTYPFIASILSSALDLNGSYPLKSTLPVSSSGE